MPAPAPLSDLDLATSVVPILQSRPGGIIPLGTGFFVSARGLLATARHVVDGDLVGDVPTGDVFGPPDSLLFVLVPSGDTPAERNRRTGVPLRQVALHPGKSDVAILIVDMSRFPPSMIQHLRPWTLAHFRPTAGEEAAALGYAGMEVGDFLATGDAGVTDLEFRQDLRSAV